jgi:hypothetical protein
MDGSIAIGGIAVIKLDINGPARPHSNPNGHPQIRPHSSTGICIGQNMLPAFCTEWNAIGRTTQSAMHAAVMIALFT